MTVFDAILLGLLQGLTEFLPISSSGHLELGKVVLNDLLGHEVEQGLTFPIVVHFATVCSTITVFWKDIIGLTSGTFAPILSGKPQWNDASRFAFFIIISMLPVILVYFLWADQVEELFVGKTMLVGFMLLVTALILWSTTWVRSSDRPLNVWRALLIGVAQAVTVLPGISRSGSTIGAGLLLGIDKVQATRFAFLMVLLPIIGATFLEVREHGMLIIEESGTAYLAGFIAAFVSGYVACRWMLNIVRKGKLAYFAIYCAVIGAAAIIYAAR